MRFSLDGTDWELQGWLAHEWELIKNVKVDAGNLDLSQVMFGETDWVPATVPGGVHADLVRAGVIAPPYEDMNSRLSEWVHDRMWLYRKRFSIPDSFAGKRLRLCFEGIDYSGRVFLDGQLLGAHEGTFVPAEFEVTPRLTAGAQHELMVMLDVPPHEPGQVGYGRQVKTLRPRFSSGWDFCTRLVNIGLWGSVVVDASGPVRVSDLFASPQLGDRGATLECSASLDARQPSAVTLTWQVLMDGREVAAVTDLRNVGAGRTDISAELLIEKPEIWWPNDMGPQALYELRLTATISGGTSHEASVPFGIRTIRLVPNDNAPPGAPPFTAEVNGQRVFLKGWNWVPLDHLYGTISEERYAWFIELAREASANCFRVWGGGIIEREVFYRLCDRAGMLVWQEMPQSSSGLDNEPPSTPEFLKNLKETARAALRARRNHPCLFAWGGGNELTYEGLRPLDAAHPNLAAIRQVIEEEAPHLAYFPTSPFGPSFDIKLENAGKGIHHDVHGPWKYQGLRAHYELFNRNDCLFHSEVGAEACTGPQSIYRFIPREKVWPPRKENRHWLHHAHWWVQWDPVTQLFGEQKDIASFVAASQLIQAEALRYAIEANRRRALQCSATLIWQFGEPWPNATATSNVDYYGIPKLGYYAAARAMRPRLATLEYDRLCWRPDQNFAAQVFLHNEGPSAQVAVKATLLNARGTMQAEAQWAVKASENSVQQLGKPRWWLPQCPFDVFFVRLEACFENETVENTYAFSMLDDLSPLLALPRTKLRVDFAPRNNAEAPCPNGRSAIPSPVTQGLAARAGRLLVTNTGNHIAWMLTAKRPEGERIYFAGVGATLMPDEEWDFEVAFPSEEKAPLVELELAAYNARPVGIQYTLSG